MEIEGGCRDGSVNLDRALLSLIEDLAVETALVVSKSVLWLLFAMTSRSNETAVLPREVESVNESHTLAVLASSTPKTAPENRDDGETDDEDDDDSDDNAEDAEDDGVEDDLSGDEGKDDEGDDDDDEEANGEEGSSDDEDEEDGDDEDDDDDDGEDEDEDEEEEDEEEEIHQPPAKKR